MLGVHGYIIVNPEDVLNDISKKKNQEIRFNFMNLNYFVNSITITII